MNDIGKIENIPVENYIFIKKSFGKTEFIFSTAKGGLDFNKSLSEGKNNLTKLKTWFNVDDIAYVNQIHSSLIHLFDGKICDGDAIINTKPNIATGVFTADCVPILIADLNKGISAAIHSGWQGTLQCIVSKTLNMLRDKYMVNPSDLMVVIGPHIKSCCYEVGEDLIAKFMQKEIYRGKNISEGRMLNLEACIKLQLKQFSIPEENIKTIGICTCCSKSYEMHSYRRDKEDAGRMFSFVVVR